MWNRILGLAVCVQGLVKEIAFMSLGINSNPLFCCFRKWRVAAILLLVVTHIFSAGDFSQVVISSMLPVLFLFLWVCQAQCGLRTYTPWHLVGNTGPGDSPQTPWVGNSRIRPSSLCFIKPFGWFWCSQKFEGRAREGPCSMWTSACLNKSKVLTCFLKVISMSERLPWLYSCSRRVQTNCRTQATSC